MAKQHEMYKCGQCGNIVQVVHESTGELSCCEKIMKHLIPGEIDAAQEKHVPVMEALAEGGTTVKVGSVAHPMEEKHYIEWIDMLTTDGRLIRQYLKPGETPEAKFCPSGEKIVAVHEYCNLHGLWKATN